MSRYFLTTTDNPFNPSKNFLEWFMFDVQKGYNSCGLLARFARTSEMLSDEENQIEIEKAIDKIVNINNLYKKLIVDDSNINIYSTDE